MERKKIVHTLDTPYSSVEWPQISQSDQDTILELLCRLLAPLGNYRRSFITPSKGKRRRRKQAKEKAGTGPEGPVPPVPQLARHVDVGLSQISRTLQAMAATKDGPGPDPAPTCGAAGAGDAAAIDATAAAAQQPGAGSPAADPAPYSVIFVARSNQSPAFHSHFPQMVAQAQTQTQTQTQSQSQSQNQEEQRPPPPAPGVRLVGFSSRGCEERLSAALGIPRVSSVGLREGAPQAGPLVELVRERVPPVEVAWLREAAAGRFLGTRIAAVPTRVGSRKKKRRVG